jgi:hypothetical protein
MSSGNINGSTDKASESHGADDPTVFPAQANDTSSHDDSEDVDIQALLSQIESADGLARGMESKLDGILETLNGFLASLESNEDPSSSASQSVSPMESRKDSKT